MNFRFKSRHLVDELGLSSTAIGRACMSLYKEKKIGCWNPDNKNKTWETIFQ